MKMAEKHRRRRLYLIRNATRRRSKEIPRKKEKKESTLGEVFVESHFRGTQEGGGLNTHEINKGRRRKTINHTEFIGLGLCNDRERK